MTCRVAPCEQQGATKNQTQKCEENILRRAVYESHCYGCHCRLCHHCGHRPSPQPCNQRSDILKTWASSTMISALVSAALWARNAARVDVQQWSPWGTRTCSILHPSPGVHRQGQLRPERYFICPALGDPELWSNSSLFGAGRPSLQFLPQREHPLLGHFLLKTPWLWEKNVRGLGQQGSLCRSLVKKQLHEDWK